MRTFGAIGILAVFLASSASASTPAQSASGVRAPTPGNLAKITARQLRGIGGSKLAFWRDRTLETPELKEAVKTLTGELGRLEQVQVFGKKLSLGLGGLNQEFALVPNGTLRAIRTTKSFWGRVASENIPGMLLTGKGWLTRSMTKQVETLNREGLDPVTGRPTMPPWSAEKGTKAPGTAADIARQMILLANKVKAGESLHRLTGRR